MSEVTIEKNIPLPRHNAGRPAKIYPWEQMEVGDSFLHKGAYSTAACAVSDHNKSNGRRFTVRKTPEGPRIWRTA